MKRIFLLLLSLLLSAATPAPQAQSLLQTYSFYDQPDWEHLTSAVMFWADLDQNGVEEPVSFTLDRDEWTTAITWGESTVVLEEGDDLVAAAALDLDAESPFYNLLVTMDYGSDSYVTVELHPENGQLVKGSIVEGGWSGWTVACGSTSVRTFWAPASASGPTAGTGFSRTVTGSS